MAATMSCSCTDRVASGKARALRAGRASRCSCDDTALPVVYTYSPPLPSRADRGPLGPTAPGGPVGEGTRPQVLFEGRAPETPVAVAPAWPMRDVGVLLSVDVRKVARDAEIRARAVFAPAVFEREWRVEVTRACGVLCDDRHRVLQPRGVSPHCETQVLMSRKDRQYMGAPEGSAVECEDERDRSPKHASHACAMQVPEQARDETRSVIEPPQEATFDEGVLPQFDVASADVRTPPGAPDPAGTAGGSACCPGGPRLPVPYRDPGCREPGRKIAEAPGEPFPMVPPGEQTMRGKAAQLFSAASAPFDSNCYCDCECVGNSAFGELVIAGFDLIVRLLFGSVVSGAVRDEEAAAIWNLSMSKGPVLRPPLSADLEVIAATDPGGPLVLPVSASGHASRSATHPFSDPRARPSADAMRVREATDGDGVPEPLAPLPGQPFPPPTAWSGSLSSAGSLGMRNNSGSDEL